MILPALAPARRLAAAFAVFLLSATGAHAGSKVAVSTPALHSLVANLLAGVDRPALLLASREALAADRLDEATLAAIAAATVVVWAGPEYERNLAAQRAIDPTAGLKGLTLSMTTPLITISRPGEPDRPGDRHDMRFWLDPRLAKVAVSRIATNLVRVYPDEGDRILENEITLKKRLGALEKQMAETLKSPEGVPLHMPTSDVLYLAWRFNLTVPTCPVAAAKSEAFGGEPGPALYFAMMAAVRDDLLHCQRQARPAS